MEFNIFKLLLVSLIELFYLVGVLIGIGFLLGVLEHKSNMYLQRSFGRKAVIVTALIGTPIHEFGHLIQCWIWRHKVLEVKFLQFNEPNGVLGYVNHQWNAKSLYQNIGNFFIGLGPIFSGIAALIGAMYILLPDSYQVFKVAFHSQTVSEHLIDRSSIQFVGSSLLSIGKALFAFSNLTNPGFWLFLFIAISVSSHMALSASDIKGALNGLISIYVLLVVLNVIATLFHVDGYNMVVSMVKYNAYLLAFSSIAFLFSLFTFGVSLLIFLLKRK